ncbi:MAG: sulfatase/phosphatase domain-containing protein, partial [Verrucomicrobiota bacterium]
GKKGAHYEGGMRVPFLASWAKRDPENKHQQALPIPSGVIQDQVASVEDLFPTILSFVKTEIPRDHKVDGTDLKTLLSGEADDSRPEEFLMHYPHGRHRSNYFTTWRSGDWKVIYHALPDEPTHGNFLQSGGETYELFNLSEDPFESNNLAKSEPKKLKSMMTELTEQLKQHDALYPVDDNGKPLLPQIPDPEDDAHH